MRAISTLKLLISLYLLCQVNGIISGDYVFADRGGNLIWHGLINY